MKGFGGCQVEIPKLSLDQMKYWSFILDTLMMNIANS